MDVQFVQFGELTGEKVRCAMLHKAGRKYLHDWLNLQSINSIKLNTRVKTTFGAWCLYSSFVHELAKLCEYLLCKKRSTIIPVRGEFGQCHPGWGRENGKPFFYSVPVDGSEEGGKPVPVDLTVGVKKNDDNSARLLRSPRSRSDQTFPRRISNQPEQLWVNFKAEWAWKNYV